MGRYITETDVIKYLGEDETDASILSDVQFVIDAAESLVDQYCRCQMDAREDEVLLLSGQGTKILVPREYVSAITLVELLDEDDATLEEYECVIMPDNARFGAGRWIERKDGEPFPEGRKNIRLTADLGFPTVPKQLEFCVALVVKSIFQRRQIDEFIAVESGNGRQIELKEEKHLDNYIPATARAILDQFKNSAGLV